ncbi:MAG: FAD-dependent oxidoreductase [Robiginitalea sp.]
MADSERKIYIVGAGISGLIAAKTLEEKGYAPVILEATDSVGGRVKTDSVSGAVLDHGFQVLLTAYPQAKKHLDYRKLHLKYFEPGALVFSKGRAHRIGDPLRDISSLLPTLFAPVGSWSDKWKIFTLTRTLKRKSIEEIFAAPEQSTRDYLMAYGFGIFLEEDLRTSSRLFEFIFKMFSEGYAALPVDGIGAISQQLADSLKATEIRFQQPVRKAAAGKITLENGQILESSAILATVPLDPKTGQINRAGVDWKRCDNLYFTLPKRTFREGIIGLVADDASLVNNLYYPFGQVINKEPLLSVTVVKDHRLDHDALCQRVRKDLKTHCGIEAGKLVKHYRIEQALPDIRNVKMDPSTGPAGAGKKIFLAGDYLLSGSLNAAMASGEAAAEQLAQELD